MGEMREYVEIAYEGKTYDVPRHVRDTIYELLHGYAPKAKSEPVGVLDETASEVPKEAEAIIPEDGPEPLPDGGNAESEPEHPNPPPPDADPAEPKDEPEPIN